MAAKAEKSPPRSRVIASVTIFRSVPIATAKSLELAVVSMGRMMLDPLQVSPFPLVFFLFWGIKLNLVVLLYVHGGCIALRCGFLAQIPPTGYKLMNYRLIVNLDTTPDFALQWISTLILGVLIISKIKKG